MNELTQNEMACFKAALALVVVKNRLKQRQQNTSEPYNSFTTRRSGEDDDDNGSSSKKRRTMDSLIFPWMASSRSSRDDLPKALPTLSLKEHLQTMMATAVRTALRLDTAKDHSALKSLEALTSHLAHQIMLALAAKMGPKDAMWIGDWIRDSLLQSRYSDVGTIKATYLIWQGILMGNFSTKGSKKGLTPEGRFLYVQAFCRSLYEKDAVPRTCQGDRASMNGPTQKCDAPDSPSPSKKTTSLTASQSSGSAASRSHDNSKNSKTMSPPATPRSPTTTTMTPGHAKKAPPSKEGKAAVERSAASFHRPPALGKKKKGLALNVNWSKTLTMGPTVKKSARTTPQIPAWKRPFSATFRSRNYGRRTQWQEESEKAKQLQLSTWTVNGLQLLQKVVMDPNSPSATTTSVLDQLPPDSVLPPTNLIQWYAEMADQRMEDPETSLDPGAKLMTMLSLYQGLKAVRDVPLGAPPPRSLDPQSTIRSNCNRPRAIY